MKEAIITRIVSNRYTVFFDGEFHIAIAMGKLRLGNKPTVGDRVQVEFTEEKWVIQAVLERKNQLIRPLVSNIDQALIVMSSKEPDFSYTLVDRLIFLISLEFIEPIIVVSKADLASSELISEITAEYKDHGYQLILTGKNLPTQPLEAILNGRLSVLAGQSGVGKSSILNRINEDLELNTQEISKALGRGRHTTRHNQLYPIAGGWLADTPGFSSLDFSSVSAQEMAQTIPDFKPYHGECRYRDCLHLKEPGCKIKEKVESNEISSRRYQHYVDCVALIKEESR
ncbi:ribosome small subunit-dependent GTPase A [Erysipelothrix sp. HDW6C]|uniref:ribosome small subunit-dependent GTPase A n=1 Tax=Erysipelothrix sp. HDW6C TaxID=2714930 RepID=UPI00140B8EF8|nr:ribosome small subunit-dependent GTPase A [Erysipelothrix sp. HDW6C]QIK70227.1 ribosome small subunit-dependent GTPase A [Erysipelothrix sp. HDW6C]